MRSTQAQGGAGGVSGGEQPQGLGQPLPGAYSVEMIGAPGEASEERVEVKEAYQQQYAERRRLRKSGKLNLAASYHTCGTDCKHEPPPVPPRTSRPQKSPITPNPKSWFQKYAELSLVRDGD